jgi:hypothetical protein
MRADHAVHSTAGIAAVRSVERRLNRPPITSATIADRQATSRDNQSPTADMDRPWVNENELGQMV